MTEKDTVRMLFSLGICESLKEAVEFSKRHGKKVVKDLIDNTIASLTKSNKDA